MKKILLLLFILALFSSCNDNPNGIFYTIKNETPLSDGSLSNTVSVDAFVELSGVYYITTGTVFKRTADPASPEAWAAIVNLATDSEVVRKCIDLAVHDSTLYGLCYDDDAGTLSYGIYSLNGTTWTPVSTLAGKTIVAIESVGTFLFACTQEGVNDYSLYSDDTDGGVGLDLSTAIITLSPSPITDIAFNGTNYWFASGSQIYYSADPSVVIGTSIPVDDIDTGVALEVKNVTSLASTNFLVSVRVSPGSCNVYQYDVGGSSWSKSSAAAVDQMLGDLSEITVDTETLIVVGAEDGYYELDLGDAAPQLTSPASSGALTTVDNYVSLDLKSFIINKFYYNSTLKHLFALTQGSGLWFDDLDPAGDFYRNWTLE